MTVLVVTLVTALTISGLCSLVEACLLSITPSQVATLSRRQPRVAAAWQNFKSSIERPVAVILIVNTAAHTIGATVAGAQFELVFGTRWMIAFSVALTYVMLQFTEILPKTLGVRYSLALAPVIAPILTVLVRVLSPVLSFVHLVNRPFESRRRAPEQPATLDEIVALAAAARVSQQIDPQQERIIRVASRFDRIRVRQIMTPRTHVDYLRLDQPIDETLRVVQASEYTRLPICDGDLDHVIGFVHIKDLFNHLELMPGRLRLLDQRSPEGELIAVPDGAPGSAVHVIGAGAINLHAIRRDVLFLPDTVSVQQALRQFQQHHTHMAVVVDEYGATQGIVTLEDAIEEFVGEIDDEFDISAPPTLVVESGRFRVSGLYAMRDLCERLGLDDAPAADSDTLSGYITAQLGRFPSVGDVVPLGPYAVRVVAVHRNRVRQAEIDGAESG